MLSERQQSLALVALLYDKEGAASLFALFPKEEKALSDYAQIWLKEPSELRQSRILKRLKKMQRVLLGDELHLMHPEWLAQLLSGESERVVAALGRLLPPEVHAALPKPLSGMLSSGVRESDSSIDPELLQFLEARMAYLLGGSSTVKTSFFSPLMRFSGPQWERLLKSVARDELAMAFYGLKKSAYLAVINRLPLADAKAVQTAMARLEGARASGDKEKQEQARRHLVSLDMERMKAEELPLLLGMYLFSKACYGEEDGRCLERVAHRFPMETGKRLIRFYKRHRAINSAASVKPYQKRFLEAADQLFGAD